MKSTTHISIAFAMRPKPPAVVREILEAAGDPPDPEWPHDFDYPSDSAKLADLLALLRKHRVRFSKFVDYQFTPAELEAAPLLYPWLEREELGVGGPMYGTRYDLSEACPDCGTGARQIGPLRLKASEIPRTGTMFWTLDHEWLVSSEIAEELSACAGLELRRATDASDGGPLPWVQLLPTGHLPRMHPDTTGLKTTVGCRRCRRDGFFHKGNQAPLIVYDTAQVDPNAIPDVVHTWECFGWSGLRRPFEESHFACPLVLVRPAVMKVLRETQTRGLRFYPVMVR